MAEMSVKKKLKPSKNAISDDIRVASISLFRQKRAYLLITTPISEAISEGLKE